MANAMSHAKRFAQAHPVQDWCKVPDRGIKIPVMKFSKRLDLPESVDNRTYCTPIEDQGSKPWCAAYTAAAFAENVMWRRDGVITQVEPEWIYKYAKKHDGSPEEDGTTLNVALDALVSKRLFDGNTCKVRFVGKGLFGIADVSDVKAAIHRFGCFLGGFAITEEWYQLANPGRTNIVGTSFNRSLGGHAVLVCGYNPVGVWIENSWGPNWGEHGFGFVEWGAFIRQFVYGAVLTNCLDGFK